MNLGQFHSILATARADINDSAVPIHLQQLVNHLEQLSENPAEADHQRDVAQSRSALLEALEATPSNDYPPSWENALQNYGLTYFLGKNVRDAVDDAFRGNDITPQAVFDALTAVEAELDKNLQHTDQILTGFDQLGVETDVLDEGDVEIAYTIPRKLREGSPSDLGREFGEIESLLKPFAEMATGQTPEFKVRSISSSDFTIVLGLNSDTVIAASATAFGATVLAAKAVQMVAAAIREIMGIYGDVVGLRRMKLNLESIGDVQEQKDTTINALEDLVKAKIDHGIAQAAERLYGKFNEIRDDEKRANEVRNHVRVSMRKIAALIDHGYDIETRRGQLPEDETEEEEGEGAEARMESQEIKDLREALEAISRAHHEQLTFERGGEPVLSLPKPSGGEADTDAV